MRGQGAYVAAISGCRAPSRLFDGL